MASTNNLVSVKLIADRLMQNPLMKDLNYEFIIDNTIQVLRLLSVPSIYEKRREALNVVNYRALKPVDMVRVNAVMRVDGAEPVRIQASEDTAQDFFYVGNNLPTRKDETYTMNSKYINFNFKEGKVHVFYEGIATDEECYPLILDNESLLRCIQSYIKYRWFDILNDMDKISDRKLAKAEADYSFDVAQAENNIKMPSEDEMEMLVNQITQILPSRTEYGRRWEYLGQQETLRIN